MAGSEPFVGRPLPATGASLLRSSPDLPDRRVRDRVAGGAGMVRRSWRGARGRGGSRGPSTGGRPPGRCLAMSTTCWCCGSRPATRSQGSRAAAARPRPEHPAAPAARGARRRDDVHVLRRPLGGPAGRVRAGAGGSAPARCSRATACTSSTSSSRPRCAGTASPRPCSAASRRSAERLGRRPDPDRRAARRRATPTASSPGSASPRSCVRRVVATAVLRRRLAGESRRSALEDLLSPAPLAARAAVLGRPRPPGAARCVPAPPRRPAIRTLASRSASTELGDRARSTVELDLDVPAAGVTTRPADCQRTAARRGHERVGGGAGGLASSGPPRTSTAAARRADPAAPRRRRCRGIG